MYCFFTRFLHFLYFLGIQASELEPLVGGRMDTIDGVVPEGDEREEDLVDLKITFRSDCQLDDLLVRFLA